MTGSFLEITIYDLLIFWIKHSVEMWQDDHSTHYSKMHAGLNCDKMATSTQFSGMHASENFPALRKVNTSLTPEHVNLVETPGTFFKPWDSLSRGKEMEGKQRTNSPSRRFFSKKSNKE